MNNCLFTIKIYLALLLNKEEEKSLCDHFPHKADALTSPLIGCKLHAVNFTDRDTLSTFKQTCLYMESCL